MQRVIKTVYTNLTDLKLAIDGTIVMSQNLSQSLDAMYDARIPDRWQRVRIQFKNIQIEFNEKIFTDFLGVNNTWFLVY
jgi:dynein heavy chain, axonemal